MDKNNKNTKNKKEKEVNSKTLKKTGVVLLTATIIVGVFGKTVEHGTDYLGNKIFGEKDSRLPVYLYPTRTVAFLDDTTVVSSNGKSYNKIILNTMEVETVDDVSMCTNIIETSYGLFDKKENEIVIPPMFTYEEIDYFLEKNIIENKKMLSDIQHYNDLFDETEILINTVGENIVTTLDSNITKSVSSNIYKKIYQTEYEMNYYDQIYNNEDVYALPGSIRQNDLYIFDNDNIITEKYGLYNLSHHHITYYPEFTEEEIDKSLNSTKLRK